MSTSLFVTFNAHTDFAIISYFFLMQVMRKKGANSTAIIVDNVKYFSQKYALYTIYIKEM